MGIQLVQKLVSVLVLFFGANLVIEGKLPIGQLIAFNMLSGQVTAPILPLPQLWPELHQLGISAERLGALLNTPPEMPCTRQPPPPTPSRVPSDHPTLRHPPQHPATPTP